jgi:D-alanine-D-alanine ligase
MQKKLTITVLLGGPSAEREVSLRTGQAAARALRSLGHDVFEVDPKPGLSALPPRTDVVFLALHGTYGEDGTVQAELERLNIPYTGCGPEASRIAFDKVLTKERCIAEGVPTARFAVVENPDTTLPSEIPLPLVVKPVRQGSSVGLQFVNSAAEWPVALRESLRFDSQVIVEQRIVGRETTVGILDRQPLPIVEVRPKQGSYDYKNKYTSGATEYLCPAPFDPAATARIQDAAMRAFDAIGGRDYARVDVMVTPSNEPIVLEVNTLPGLTETSLLPKAAAAAGISYEALCQRMIDLALVRPALAV